MLGYLTEYLVASNNTSLMTSGSIQSQHNAYMLAAGIVLCSYTVVVLSNATFHMGRMMGLKIKIISTGVIYQKVLSF